MSVKYYDIVPKSDKSARAEDFRRALLKVGFKPIDRGGFRWRAESDDGNLEAFLLVFSKPCLFYSNTRTLKVTCPFCRANIDINMWHRALSHWRATGDDELVTPCCSRKARLGNLIYDPPIYFTTVAISFCAPEGADPPKDIFARISRALGKPLDWLERLC